MRMVIRTTDVWNARLINVLDAGPGGSITYWSNNVSLYPCATNSILFMVKLQTEFQAHIFLLWKRIKTSIGSRCPVTSYISHMTLVLFQNLISARLSFIIIVDKIFEQVTHKGGDFVMNYIKRLQHEQALSVSLGNTYSEDKLMHIFMDEFFQGGKYSAQIPSYQEELSREEKYTDKNLYLFHPYILVI